MFDLWIGVMTGIVLAYLWEGPHRKAKPSYWSSPLPFSQAALAVLLITFGWELWHFGSGSLGALESVKVVLMPWAAGVGFGVWMYSILYPHFRQANGGGVTPGQPGSGGPPVPPPQPDKTGAGTPSFLPLAIAILFVAIIVSDERYGWFDRLQKLTVGGSGIEFAPRSGGQPEVSTSGLQSIGLKATSGAERIQSLLFWMSQWDQIIRTDQASALETGHEFSSINIYLDADLEIAEKVIVPLGDRLSALQGVRHYNGIEFIANRRFIDEFRLFVRTPPEDRVGSDKERIIQDGFANIWKGVCKSFSDPRVKTKIDAPDKIEKDDREKWIASCDADMKKANEHIAKLFVPDSHLGFSPKLPYGTLLSSLMLLAAGESGAAVADLDAWINSKTDSKEPRINDFRWIGRYRLRNMSASLFLDEAPAELSHSWARRFNRAIFAGEKLLASSYSYKDQQTWRNQTRLLFKTPTWEDVLWGELGCPESLSRPFKFMMQAHLSTINNFAFFLSQNFQFAKLENYDDWMAKQASRLASVKLRCLQHEEKDDPIHEGLKRTISARKLVRLKSSYLDTAAAIEFTLAADESRRPREARAHLCVALKYAQAAAASDRFPMPSTNSSPETSDESVQRTLLFAKRQREIQSALMRAGFDCS
jgi:hypothetical protein